MKLTSILATMFCLLAIGAIAQQKEYTITGNIKNLPDGTVFYLILNKDDGGADTVSRVKSKDQKFMLKGTLTEEGRLAFVKMDTSIVKLHKGKQSWTRLLLDHSEVALTGDLGQWPEVTVKGSIPTQDFSKVSKVLKLLKDAYNAKVTEVSGDTAKQNLIYSAYNVEYVKALQAIPGSYALPILILNNAAFGLGDLEREYAKLLPKLKSSYYGKQLSQKIISTKASKVIGIGKVIPDFKVKSPDGKVESVRDLAMKSKYTLVDFWASWCAPCRADIPNMKKVYNAFNAKGFNILSVSTDSSLGSWQKALKEENTPWTNGIQEGKPGNDIFGLSAIPAYILLNEKAEIIQMDLNSKFFGSDAIGTMSGAQVYIKDKKSRGLRGDDLYEVIEEVLGKSEVNK